MQDAPGADLHHDERVHGTEQRRMRDDEVARDDGTRMIAYECGPRLVAFAGWPATRRAKVLAHCSCAHLDTQFQTQFRRDPAAAPTRIVSGHSANQRAQFGRNGWPAAAGPPSPEHPKALSLPRNQRRRLHDDERLPPVEASREQRQPTAFERSEAAGTMATIREHRQLAAQKKYLGQQRGVCARRRSAAAGMT